MDNNNQENSTLELATELTIAWLSNPNTRASTDEVPAFLQQMHQAVQALASPADQQQQDEPAQEYTPAVSARKSLVSKDHIISMIDGKPYKTLRRHLARQSPCSMRRCAFSATPPAAPISLAPPGALRQRTS